MNNFLNETVRNESAIKRQIKQISIKHLAKKLGIFALKEVNYYYLIIYLKLYIFAHLYCCFYRSLFRIIKKHVRNKLLTCFLFVWRNELWMI